VTAAGMVDLLTLVSLEPGDVTSTIRCACVDEDAEAFYGYPGDVVYPKDSWAILHRHGSCTLAEHAAAEQAAWDAGLGKQFAGS
jgi:hypothetical protein